MAGLPERWQRSDQNSPFSQGTLHDGNQLTIVPIVNWSCRGGALGVDLTLYNNAIDAPPPPSPPESPPLGYGWTHSYLTKVSEDSESGDVTVTEGDGRKHVFTKYPDATYTRPKGIFETLVKNGDGSFRLTRKDQIKWNFAASGRLNSIIDLNNNSISFSYNGAGRLTSLADPSGRTLSFAYDANGFLSSVTDPINRTFTFGYSGTPVHLWKVQEPSPSTNFIEFGYDASERVASLKDKRGNTWTIAYHPFLPRVSTVTNPESNSRSYFYLTGTSVTDENGNQSNYTFGSDGQVVGTETIPGPGTGLDEIFTYDADLNLTSFTRPSGAVWEFTADDHGNLLGIEDPITRLEPAFSRGTMTYDAANRITSARNASGNQQNYVYDSVENLIQVTDAASNITTYGYDSFGHRTSYTVNGRTTALGYDAHGNLTSVTDPLGNATQFTYNALGWRTSRTDAMGRVTNLTYDVIGRVATVSYPSGPGNTFLYDANGNRTSMTDATGTTTWTYSALNLVLTETKGSDSISNTYDPGGRRTGLTDQAAVAVTYEYDGANRLTRASRGPHWSVTYTHDDDGNIISQTNPNGTTVTQGFNSASWLTSVVNKKSDGTTLSSFTYAYNINALRSTVTENDGSVVTYGYDALLRLTSEVRTAANPYTTSYGYDPAGNRLNKVVNGVATTYTYDDANRLLTAGSSTYNWNANGALVSKTEGGATTSFSYDFDDRLTSISGSSSAVMSYDGLGRRVTRTAGGATTMFGYDGARPTTERVGATLAAHYTYGASLVSRDDGTDFSFLLFDGLGSTRQLTDGTQSVTASLTFEGFGNIIAQSGSSANPYKFAADSLYRDDGDAGLMLVGLRYYDPAVGRFTTADPYLGDALNPQSLNRYAYVGNNPVNLVDPSGRSWVDYLVGGVIAVGSVALAVLLLPVELVAGGGLVAVLALFVVAGAIAAAATGLWGFFSWLFGWG